MNRTDPPLNWTVSAPETPRVPRYTSAGFQQSPDERVTVPIPSDPEVAAVEPVVAERPSEIWPAKAARRRMLGEGPSAKVVVGSLLVLTGLGAASFTALYSYVHASDGAARAAALAPARVIPVPVDAPRAVPPPSLEPLASAQLPVPAVTPLPFSLGADPLMISTSSVPVKTVAAAPPSSAPPLAVTQAPRAQHADGTPKPVARRDRPRAHPVVVLEPTASPNNESAIPEDRADVHDTETVTDTPPRGIPTATPDDGARTSPAPSNPTGNDSPVTAPDPAPANPFDQRK